MECDRISELLPWLANGTLKGAEQEIVREHLSGCQSCRRELDETLLALSVYQHHPPAEALIDYAFDQPVATMDIGLLESHLQTCPHCSEQFEMARASRLLEQTETDRVVPMRPKVSERRASIWRYAAIAASLIAFIAIAGWLWGQQQKTEEMARLTDQQREMSERLARLEAESRIAEAENLKLKETQSLLQQQKQEADREIARLQGQIENLASPQLNAPTLDVYPGELIERAGGRTANEITIPRDARSVTLILNSQSSGTYPDYSIEIVNARNRIIWSARGLVRQPTNDYTINVATSLLPSGSYTINIYGRDRSKRVKVESYPIRITRSRASR